MIDLAVSDYLFTLGMFGQCLMEDKKDISRDLFPGALEMMILESLRRQPAHGYALVQHIQQRSKNLLQVEEGSLYPALQRLLKTKMVKTEWTISPSTNRRKVRAQILRDNTDRPLIVHIVPREFTACDHAGTHRMEVIG